MIWFNCFFPVGVHKYGEDIALRDTRLDVQGLTSLSRRMGNDCEGHYYQTAGGQVLGEVVDPKVAMDH